MVASDVAERRVLPTWRAWLSGKTWYLFAIALTAVVAFPILRYFAQAFSDGGGSLRRVLDMPGFGTVVLNTIYLAAGSTVMGVVLAVAIAKSLLHIPRRFQKFAAVVPLIPLVMPPLASVIGWVFVFSPTVGYGNTLLRKLPFFDQLKDGPVDIYSMPAIIVVTGFDLTAVIFTFVYARLQEIRGPLESAAQLCGASALKSFMTVTLPLLRPSIIAGAVVAFLLGLGQFTGPLILGSRNDINVITTEIFSIREDYPIDYGATAVLGLPLLIVGIVLMVGQRFATGDPRKYVTQTGGGGGVTSRPSYWAAAFVGLYGLVAVVIPLAAIILVSFSPYWTGDLDSVALTLDNIRDAFSSGQVLPAVRASLTTSIGAALIALPLGFLAAIAMIRPFRAPRGAQYLLDSAFLAPLVVPRAILGLAVLFVFLRPPFSLYGTYALFILGYLFVVLPFSVRIQYGSLIGVSSSLFEAAQISGAGKLRTLIEIALPLARRGIAAAATIMFVILSHDFAVSVMVRAPGNHVMGTLLYEYWTTGVYPQVAVMALIMTVVTAIGLLGILGIGGRSALEKL